MSTRIALLTAGLIGVLSFSTGLAQSPVPVPPRAKLLAFVGVTVIPMDSERRLADHTVLVADGMIQRVGPRDQVAIPRGAIRVDGRGKFLIPGLADMHAHLSVPDDLLLHLSYGVTFVRALWGEQPILDLRDGVRQGKLLGPRVLAGSRIVDGKSPWHFGSFSVVDQADADRTVRAIKAKGYDFIKVYSVLTPPAYDAIALAAKREGIPFGGHVPMSVSLAHAFDAGQRSIEHLTNFLKENERDGPPQGLDIIFQPLGPKPVAALGRGETTLDQAFDQRKLEALAARAAKSSTWNVPTLVVIRSATMSPNELAAEAQRPDMRFVQPAVRNLWALAATLYRGADADVVKGKQLLLQQHYKQVLALQRAGAGLLAGTDTPNPYIFPGLSLHDELALMVQSGLTPYEALRTATAGPAHFVNAQGQFGTVVEGARADLVLLDGDPLADIANSKRIAGVSVDGRWQTRAQLLALIEPIARQVAFLDRRFGGAQSLSTVDLSKATANIALQVFENGRDVGAERYAVLPGAEKAKQVFAQSVVGERTKQAQSHALSWGANGELVSYRLDESQSWVELQRAADGALSLATSRGRLAVVGTCEAVVTGTAADAAALSTVLASVEEGGRRSLDVCRLTTREGGQVQRETWTIVREPQDTIRMSTFLTGAKPYRITGSSADNGRQQVLWTGGGFWDGQFMAAEELRNGNVVRRKTRYQ